MADVLGDPTFYLILIVMVILGVVTFYEIKFIRKRRMERDAAKVQMDDTYNQIITSRAVSRALKQQGKDTKEADLALVEADTAFSRGSYVEAKAASERAKELLRTAKERPAPEQNLESLPGPAPAEKKEEGCELPFQEAKKMPRNFMESKFMICSVRDEAAEAERAGKDVSIAQDSLRLADDAFQAERYTEALKHALRAKKSLEPREEAAPPAKGKDLASVERVPSAVVVKAPVSKCSSCSSPLDPADMFCAKCGGKVERDIRCPRCTNPVKVEDAYCRKCGLPLRSD
jgi:hypothetical protein